jgi:hypothetical protein
LRLIKLNPISTIQEREFDEVVINPPYRLTLYLKADRLNSFFIELTPELIGFRFRVQGSRVTTDGHCSKY